MVLTLKNIRYVKLPKYSYKVKNFTVSKIYATGSTIKKNLDCEPSFCLKFRSRWRSLSWSVRCAARAGSGHDCAVWKGAGSCTGVRPVEFPSAAKMQPGVKCQFTGVLCVYSGHFHTRIKSQVSQRVCHCYWLPPQNISKCTSCKLSPGCISLPTSTSPLSAGTN